MTYSLNQVIDNLRQGLAKDLSHFTKLQNSVTSSGIPLTVVCIPRHGFATTLLTIESFFENTQTPAIFIYINVMGPEILRPELTALCKKYSQLVVLNIDANISRQMSRHLILDRIRTQFTLFLDNNMLLSRSSIDRLIQCANQDNAAVVSPVIVMHGGNMHFSGAKISQKENGWFKRSQTTTKSPARKPIEECHLEKQLIDFAESHCCLMRTSTFAENIHEFMPVWTHNSHTLAVSCLKIKQKIPDVNMLIEPESVVSVLPIGAGYDIPWLFSSYNNWSYFKQSYDGHFQMVKSKTTSIENLRWHRKHLLYVFQLMIEKNMIDRQNHLQTDDIPRYVSGYDYPLPEDLESVIEKQLLPFIKVHYPQFFSRFRQWLHNIDDIINHIELHARYDSPCPWQDPLVPRSLRGITTRTFRKNLLRRASDKLRIER